MISGARLLRSLFLLGLLTACSSHDDPIRIGVLGPLSTNDGIPMNNAAILAMEEINRAGGIGGRQLELVLRDDYGNADSAIRAAGELAESDVVAVIGYPAAQQGKLFCRKRNAPTEYDNKISLRQQVHSRKDKAVPGSLSQQDGNLKTIFTLKHVSKSRYSLMCLIVVGILTNQKHNVRLLVLRVHLGD